MRNMKVKELIAKFPKAMRKFGDYIAPILFKDEKVDEKELETFLDIILSNAPRTLYDFFDTQGLYISTMYNADEEYWTSTIFNVSKNIEDLGLMHDSRPDAERFGYEQSFKMLEEKL